MVGNQNILTPSCVSGQEPQDRQDALTSVRALVLRAPRLNGRWNEVGSRRTKSEDGGPRTAQDEVRGRRAEDSPGRGQRTEGRGKPRTRSEDAEEQERNNLLLATKVA